MHTNVSYKGRDPRDSILDLVQWFGFRKSLGIFRHFRAIQVWYAENQEAEGAEQAMIKAMNGATFAIEIGGVSGEPVRQLVKRFFGDTLYQKWIES